MSYRASNNLNRMLCNTKQCIPDIAKSGVYKISCETCNKFYIGQTGRSLKERFSDHLHRNASSMYKHLTQSNHKTTINSMILLHNAPKSKKLNILEELEIARHQKRSPDLLLNEITCTTGAHLFNKFI